MRFDGPAALRKMLDHPELFPIAGDVDAMARKIVVAQLKGGVDLARLKSICLALGADSFTAIVEGISDAEAKSFVGKIDKDNKEAKLAGGAAQRILLIELATGDAEPRAKAIKEREKKSTSRPSTSSAGKAINSRSTGATRKRTVS
jgi:hypothetical protein